MLASAGSVMAYSSAMGPTGGAGLPNADVVDQDKCEIAHDIQNRNYPDGMSLSQDNTRLLYGAAKNTEVGILYASLNESSNLYNITHYTRGINAKKCFGEKSSFKTAIGIAFSYRSPDIYGDESTYRNSHIYGVASHVFHIAPDKVELTGSLGIDYSGTHCTEMGVVSYNATDIRSYIIADFAFHGGATLTAECYLKKINKYLPNLTSLVLHYPITRNFSLKLGTINGYGPPIVYEHQPIFGIDYSFSR